MKKKCYCYDCDKDVTVVKKEIVKTYVVHNSDVQVREEVFVCPKCHNELIDNNLDISLYAIYNEYLKLYNLSFEKLRKIRESYNLSQELFAMALNMSKRSIIRYENAATLPQKQSISIYQQIDDNKDAFISILESNKDKIEKNKYLKIYDSINADLSLKTINVFLYVLEKVHLTRTQIMKYFFAIDFENYKSYGKPITSFKYAHGFYGPIIDKKDVYLNLLLKQGYIETLSDSFEDTLYKSIKTCDLSLLTIDEKKTIDKVLKKFGGKKAKDLTNWSHNFVGWNKTSNGKIIDYKYSKEFDLDSGW